VDRLEEVAEDLYENAPCGYLSTTMDGTIVRANRTFLEWAGYSADEVVERKKFQDLLTAGGRIYHETHYSPLLRMQRAAREIALDIVAADGSRLPALVNAVVNSRADEDKEVVRIVVLPADHRREYERELLRARQRAEESEERARELAQTLQASLIPPAPPMIPGVDIGVAYRPAGSGDEVGGDFFDVFEIARDDWAIVIGDVQGKGAQAATVTALARYTVRAAAIQVRQPRLILGLLNDAMLRQHGETFCTIAYARVRRRDGSVRITLASGGHPLPILVSDGVASEVGEPGTLIGVLPQPKLYDKTITLEGGDVLTFFTDGVTEARGTSGFFDEDRLMDLLVVNRELAAGRLADQVVTEVVEFQEGHPRDDIAVVTLKVPVVA
jgi:sigma-B regulation protein RsbU (phosphoserine phosphatase)